MADRHVIEVQTTEATEWAKERAVKQGVVLLLQFGNDACERCPEFAKALEDLKEEFNFMHAYCNTHYAEDLLETYLITKVPSFVIMNEHMDSVFLDTDVDTLKREVQNVCRPVLRLDAEF